MIDISLLLRTGMPVWPGSPGLRLAPLAEMGKGDPINVSRLDLEVHTGTHVDAPRHFFPEGGTAERLDLNVLVGPAQVAYLPAIQAITGDDLQELELPPDTERLLLRTRNSELWAQGEQTFREDFVALTLDAARWVVDRRIRLLGIDYLSVQRFGDDPETHRVLLSADIILLEGLDLSRVEAGQYELLCLPLRLAGAEAAPARAVLRPYQASNPASP